LQMYPKSDSSSETIFRILTSEYFYSDKDIDKTLQ